jgi:tetratricopeptide (TPR) repeat protein
VQRAHLSVVLGLTLSIACGLSCSHHSPQVDYNHAYQTFVQGNLKQAQQEAEEGRQRFQHSRPDWSSRFRALEAEALLLRGMSREALALISSQIPDDRNVAISMLATQGVAYARLHSFPDADYSLKRAEQLCASDPPGVCGSVMRAQGVVAVERGQMEEARTLFARSLTFAREKGDRFLEATALLNLGLSSLNEEHFDEAVDSTSEAYRISREIGAESVATKALGNLGWAYYRLGDHERALQAFQESEKHAAEIGNVFDQENELTNIGYVQMDARQFDKAAQSFQQALKLADGIKAKQDTYNALRVLARLALQTNNLGSASRYAERALQIARESGKQTDELYPILVQGQVAARRGNTSEAEGIFQQVEREKTCPVFLKWEAEHLLAQLYEKENHPNFADREYRAALATFEAARHSVRHEDSQLSFVTNAGLITVVLKLSPRG